MPEKLNKGAELEQILPGSESERVEHSEKCRRYAGVYNCDAWEMIRVKKRVSEDRNGQRKAGTI